MYQEHFNLTCAPFSLTPDTHFFCQSSQHIGALNTAKICLKQGEGFIKITGEVGCGKTLLCRLLLNQLPNETYVTAYLPNPHIRPEELARVIAKELNVDVTDFPTNHHDAQETLLKHLIQLHQSGKTVVLLLDEAQAMPVETLEALRLITNLEAETHKLLHIILLGQPELNDKLNLAELRQLKQRIAFSYQLNPLTKAELHAYIRHRLAIAGQTYGNLFTDKAIKMIYHHSRGIPRVVNILCHKSLLTCYGLGQKMVTSKFVKIAKKDTDFAKPYSPPKKFLPYFLRLLGIKKGSNHELN
jgi:MSHA biogenesis protein MshM